MKKITLENVYDKLDEMGFEWNGLFGNVLSLDIDIINKNDNAFRIANINVDTKTVEINDFVEDDTTATFEEFEIFKGSWHDFLEWEC